MGKKTTKKKKKGSLVKQLIIIISVVVVLVVGVVIIGNVINKTTIKTITVEGAYSELYLGSPDYSEVEVGVSVYPETASASSLVAYSENPEVATVSYDGKKIKVSSVGIGETNIVVRHPSKASLNDTFKVSVSDVDVQNVSFMQKNNQEELEAVQTISIKKDGFDHLIPLQVEPLNANLNNIRVTDFNQFIFEKVEIDMANKSLLIVPKIDIIQTSAEVDVEIFQNTTEGYSAVQVKTLKVNLLNREAYVNFELAETLTKGYKTLSYNGVEANTGNIVYLETPVAGDTNRVTDVYVKPIIGYDRNFESVGNFNFEDYDLYFDGENIFSDEYKTVQDGVTYYNYNDKLMVTKEKGNQYYFKTSTDFKTSSDLQDADCIFVEFKHKYTSARSGLQFIGLATANLVETGSGFTIENLDDVVNGRVYLNVDEVFSVKFSYDNLIEKGILSVTSISSNDNLIEVRKENKKFSIIGKEVTDGVVVRFNLDKVYWDSRYATNVEIDNNKSYTSVTIVVENPVNGLHLEKTDGTVVTLLNGNNIDEEGLELCLITEPIAGVINGDVQISITKDNSASDDLSVVEIEGTKDHFKLTKKPSISGTYIISFEYKGQTALLYVVV